MKIYPENRFRTEKSAAACAARCEAIPGEDCVYKVVPNGKSFLVGCYDPKTNELECWMDRTAS